MGNPRIPDYYKASLTSRKSIIDFLVKQKKRNDFPLAWDVKAHYVNLEFDNLFNIYEQQGIKKKWFNCEEKKKDAKKKYEENEHLLLSCAIEDARSSLSDYPTYKTLWNGKELDIVYEFAGRSGGWIVIAKFEGEDFSEINGEYFEGYLSELPYKSLRNLYKLVVQNNHDFRKEAVNNEIEFHGAFNFFENICYELES